MIGETRALEKLKAIKTAFATRIRGEYEYRAKSCSTCETPGACCLDAHFVNVRITRLEAVAIGRRLESIDNADGIYRRIDNAIEKYGLADAEDGFSKTYSCPLFEKGIGCLVHGDAKPLPCIAHACYEQREDLPPDELLAEREIEVDNLNEKVYGSSARWLPLPVAIKLHSPRDLKISAIAMPESSQPTT